jgi:hypothetical protein
MSEKKEERLPADDPTKIRVTNRKEPEIENQYEGEIPVRQNITVLPSDDPEKFRLNWYVFEGDIILRDGEGFNQKEYYEEVDIGPRDISLHKDRLKIFEDIKVGDTVYCTWYDESPVAMEIQKVNEQDKTAWAKLSESCFATLSFNKDIRECWCCAGYCMINNEALAKVSKVEFNGGDKSEEK